jgi:hypothetical protein
MNEFNPAVQARMKRLEEENAHLRASGGTAESAAHIAGLEAELEDCRRLKTLFTTRYHEVSEEGWEWGERRRAAAGGAAMRRGRCEGPASAPAEGAPQVVGA